MRIRIYVPSAKGSDEGHLDYSPPHGTTYKAYGGTTRIACGGSFEVRTKELIEIGEVLTLLDKYYERKGDC